MTFAHPWMLLGALAAFIPLLVHLFDRRRPRPHPFGPLAFVLRSQKRTASRLKLKRLLLYVLRTLIFLALPIALARPEWRNDATAAAVVKGPAATAIVLDASLSMRWAEGASLFERAQEEARDALSDLRPEEPATVLVCTSQPEAPAAPGFDRAKLRAVVDEAKPTYAGADLSRCLELAARSLEESPMAGKRLVVVSDLTAGSLRLEAPPPVVKGPTGEAVRPEVVLRDAAGRDELPNHALVDLKVEPALQAGPRAFQFTFTVKNFGTAPVKDLEAAVRVGEATLGKGFVDVPANGTAQKTLTVRFTQGGVSAGEAVLTPDGLAEDDRRAFVLNVPRVLRALVVNGAPHATRYRDEAFFLEAALTAPGSPVQVALRDTAAGWAEDFSTYDLVYLLNVPAPEAGDAAKLAAFVENGGGLFVSMGDQVNPDAYNARLGALLPRPLRLVRTSVERDDPEAADKAAQLTQVKQEHPLFTPFTGQAEEGLVGARFYRYMLLEADSAAASDGASQVLATYEDGAPAVAVARRGKGRVALFTSTVDRDWSDFAIRTSFLPLMQRFAAYLTGSLEEREEQRVRVGESLTLHPEGTQAVSLVRGPGEREVPVKVQPDGSVVVGPVEEPGTFTVLGGDGKPVPALGFAATLDPTESDLSRLPAEALSAHFGEETVKASSTDAERPPVPLWTWLIVAAALAFFAEGLLLRK